jgi:hypothetical protein
MPASETTLARAGEASPLRLALATLAVIAAMAAVLYSMGRIPICACGTVKLWHGVTNSAENSQHVLDWYTPTHVIHGFLFFALFSLVGRLRGRAIPFGAALIAALVLEGLWEIAENTPAMIERYRSTTISLGYNGDSIVNSIADMLAMTVGFVLAARLPAALSAALVIITEIILALFIRDNLVLNLIMLIWPLDGIKAWQAGA